jgi:hypothetical protein
MPSCAATSVLLPSKDEAMVVEHLVSIGRRNAIERTAHFFMELGERMLLVGLSAETEFECPLTQYVLADALALSAVHSNRVLRQLRELSLLSTAPLPFTICRACVSCRDFRAAICIDSWEAHCSIVCDWPSERPSKFR